jgi:hypothetical protein
MNETHNPVEELSGALGRKTQTLPELDGADCAGQLKQCREQLARDLAVCIESLQFHDRLIQQLTHVRNILASVTMGGLSAGAQGDSIAGDPQSWQVLVENLRSRFTSDSHRILFNLLVSSSGAHVNTPSLHANEGSVELF